MRCHGGIFNRDGQAPVKKWTGSSEKGGLAQAKKGNWHKRSEAETCLYPLFAFPLPSHLHRRPYPPFLHTNKTLGALASCRHEKMPLNGVAITATTLWRCVCA